MRLAEALILRAGIQKKLASLRERITQNAKVQEGDVVAEDPNALLAQSVAVLEELEGLVFRINQANLLTKLPDGRSITQAIAHRENLTQRHSLLEAAIAATRPGADDRYSMREIKWVPTLDVARLQAQVEDLSKQIRELNTRIQETNWKAEIE